MNRLTDRSKEIQLPCTDNGVFWARVHEKLARYEDTGMEPEECAKYAKAEKEGRLLVLPCGDDVTPIKCTGLNCPMQVGKVDPATCKAADTCEWATKPLTNADRIRAMSDEELAEWLKYERISVCPPDTGHIHCNISDICADRKCWLDWLKQEAKE